MIAHLNREREVMSVEDLARAAWPVAVGKKIASYTAAVALVRGRLIIEVQDIVWQRQLTTLSLQIVKNLAGTLGKDVVTGLDFRPMTPRRMPQRAESASSRPSESTDEADAIQDSGLRRVYRISRKRLASA